MILKKTFKNNQIGFSLIEVMVVMLVMIIISTNLAKLSQSEQAAAFKFQANIDMNATVAEIGVLLADPAKCAQFLTSPSITLIDQKTTIPLPPGTINPVTGAQVTPGNNLTSVITGNSREFRAAVYHDDAIKDYRDYSLVLEKFKFGNSKIAIHSFELQGWTGSASNQRSTITLVVNFFRKNAKVWANENSTWIGKAIQLSITTTATKSLDSCVAVNYINKDYPVIIAGDNSPPKNIANGFKVCPQAMTLVGLPTTRSSFCIDTSARFPSKMYYDALDTCSKITDNAYQLLGSAHLCTFGEWNTAYYQKDNISYLIPAVAISMGTQPEWVISPPTTNFNLTTTPVTPSMVKQITTPISGKVNVFPTGADPAINNALIDANAAKSNTSLQLANLIQIKNNMQTRYYNACNDCQTSYGSLATTITNCQSKASAVASYMSCATTPTAPAPVVTCVSGTDTTLCSTANCYSSTPSNPATQNVTTTGAYPLYKYTLTTQRCDKNSTKNTERLNAQSAFAAIQTFNLVDDFGYAVTLDGNITDAIAQQQAYDISAATIQGAAQVDFNNSSPTAAYRCCFR